MTIQILDKINFNTESITKNKYDKDSKNCI